MDNLNDLLKPNILSEEEPIDRRLRPDNFSRYIGQSSIKDSLKIAIQAAKQRKNSLDHVLLYGPPGLGKTSLAYIIAHEMEVNLRISSGPAISKGGDLAAILTNLQDGDVLFIDEIHRLPRSVEEILYPAMEEHYLDIMLGKGPSARSVRIDLPNFTLVGATTRAGALSHPLRDRFGHIHRLEYYEDEELAAILDQNSQILELNITQPALLLLAGHSRKTPRVANRLLRRIRDHALVKGYSLIDCPEVESILSKLDIDSSGLDKLDRLLLQTLQDQFGGGPVGLETLAATLGEESNTLEEVIEPYLLRLGFLERTARGRQITDLARIHLQKDLK